MSIDAIRENYDYPPFLENDVHDDPIEQFRQWFEEAWRSDARQPNAMTLATCSKDGTPSARVVLLKGFDHKGFVFFTNYQSAKAADLEENPKATLVFYWPQLSRTVRISGSVEKVSREETDAYFMSRPRDSQLGAWASNQSSVDRKPGSAARTIQASQATLRWPGRPHTAALGRLPRQAQIGRVLAGPGQPPA